MTKEQIRNTALLKRKQVDNKKDKDSKIAQNLIGLSCIKNAETVLCYVSLDGEISTDYLIETFLKDKKVAVPFCIDNNGNMNFYLIDSLSLLKPGSFSVREPDINECEKLTDFTDSVIIVPALCFDKKGNRLGYGKGFYDRFLKKYPFISVGLCYNSLIVNDLPCNEYDIPVDIIVTETSVIEVKSGGKNG